MNAIWTLFLETTPTKLKPVRSSVLWPSLIYLTFLVKSILRSQTKWPEAFVYPAGAHSTLGKILKATYILVISFASVSIHGVLPFFLSNLLASLTYLRISMPYLWVVTLILDLIWYIIQSAFFSVYGTHQLKAGSSAMFVDVANKVSYTGLDFFNWFNITYISDWSFNLDNIFQSVVGFLWYLWLLW